MKETIPFLSNFLKKEKHEKYKKPLEKLELVHTRIASLLSRIALPEYLHSGKKKCSNVTNAKAHLNNEKMMTTDIKAFFHQLQEG